MLHTPHRSLLRLEGPGEDSQAGQAEAGIPWAVAGLDSLAQPC